jgi:hypothetical protein
MRAYVTFGDPIAPKDDDGARALADAARAAIEDMPPP